MPRTKPTTLKPKLRFPAFRDQTGWKVRKLGDCFSHRQENGFNDLPLLSLTEQEGLIPQSESGRKDNSNTDKSKYLRVCPGDIAYNTMRMWEGRSALADAEGIVSPAYTICKPRSGCDSIFFSYLFKTPRAIADFRNYSQGIVKDTWSLKFASLKKISVACPSEDEQRAIAECLGSVDAWLAAAERKLAALRDHKRGLMQQLFPQPGQSQPQQRFPEFRKAGKWIEMPLGKLLSRKPEYGVNAAAVPFSQDLPLYIRITDIDDDGNFTRLNRVSVDIDAIEENYLVEGDIALARTGASVGKSYRYREVDGRLVFAGFLIRVRPNPKKLVSEFLANYLTTWQYWDWVRVNSARSGQPGINGSEYASMPVPLPPAGPKGKELAEQQKIAACLTALVTQIAAQAAQIESLKTHKHGLMQQLFPSFAF